MNDLYVFLIRNDVWIYIICSLGILWYLSEYLRARAALRRAMFRLEQETARGTRNRALLFLLIFGVIVGTVTYVNWEIAPTLPPSLLKPPTPTPDPLQTTATPETAGTLEPEVTPTSPVAPTVTLPGEAPAATETPAAPPETPGTRVVPTSTPPTQGCTPSAQITDPREAARVQGILNVFGTADTPEFGYYELDINGPQTNQRWASLLGRRVDVPVDDGFLGGNINLTQWQSGPYLIRLTVANDEGQVTHQCVVDIMLETGR
jgi:hypothetical protein